MWTEDNFWNLKLPANYCWCCLLVYYSQYFPLSVTDFPRQVEFLIVLKEKALIQISFHFDLYPFQSYVKIFIFLSLKHFLKNKLLQVCNFYVLTQKRLANVVLSSSVQYLVSCFTWSILKGEVWNCSSLYMLWLFPSFVN